MRNTMRRALGYRVSVGELIVLAIGLGTPYLLVGVVWASTHSAHLADMSDIDAAVSYLGAIASWPVLLFSDVTMT